MIRSKIVTIFSLLLLVIICSCTKKYKTISRKEESKKLVDSTSLQSSSNPEIEPVLLDLSPPPISQFVRRIFQDSRGDLWLGTNGDGVLRYNGKSVDFFNRDKSFTGDAVRAILEDTAGNVWIGTNRGLIKYDPIASAGNKKPNFTTYTTENGLVADDIWSLYLDEKGIFWIGTVEGVSKFDGIFFTYFPLPESKRDESRGVTSTKIIHHIMEDTKGNLWFASNGGALIWNGKSVELLSEEDGLAGNNTNHILEDRQGNMWFATHHNGVSRYDGKSFTNFTKDRIITGVEVWSLFEDSKENIWFPAENAGVYKYDGKSFTKFTEEDGVNSNAIQTIYEDASGTIWIGGYLGLSRLKDDRFISVTENGPWGDD